MKRDFFNKFRKQEKNISRPLSLQESEWDMIDAYRLFGSAKTGYEISLHSLVREIVFDHINKNIDFIKTQEQWVRESKESKKAAVTET